MRDSAMEIKIYDILKDAGLPFEEEYIFDDLIASSGRPLRFDFAVFTDDGDIDFLIEAQGEQHYQPIGKFGGGRSLKRQQYNDVSKKRYCMEHGYNLICIPYYDMSKLNYNYIMTAAGY